LAYEPIDNAKAPLSALLQSCASRLAALYAESGAAKWQVSQEQFEEALERSARKRFASSALSAELLEEYLATLYAEDLGLACGCMNGCEAAWECFVREYRGYLRAATAAMTKGGRGGIQAEELADSLFADLYGLSEAKRGQGSLLRYFHGRSSLKTWLRAILAQRHVDKIRELKRWESLDGANGDGDGAAKLPAEKIVSPQLDPYRDRYVRRFVAALEASIPLLRPVDRQRLELYYSGQKTLAEIGRVLREHESSASRNLERTRRELRAGIEAHLRGVSAGNDGTVARAPMSDEEIALCFQYAAEDVPIDFRLLFLKGALPKPSGEQGESL
jgi:RNA polymerase sigma-70 factor (ECF subfamily)